MDINVIVLTGNLAQPPDWKLAVSGAAVCRLRLANNVWRKRGEDWVKKTSFVDAEVWGGQALSCAKHLVKGSRVAVRGEFEIDEWTDARTGERRSRPIIRHASVTFEGSPRSESSTDSEPVAAPHEPPPELPPQ